MYLYAYVALQIKMQYATWLAWTIGGFLFMVRLSIWETKLQNSTSTVLKVIYKIIYGCVFTVELISGKFLLLILICINLVIFINIFIERE